jgi:hypothetical protein
MDDNKPLLTLAQLQSWQARRVEIASVMGALAQEDGVLARKIEAAKIFVDDAMENDAVFDEELLSSSPDAPTMEVAEANVSRAVLAAVGAMKGTPKAAAIRRWITVNNPEVATKLDASPAYLYTTLMRHVRGKRLAKRGKGYRLPIGSPKGETGGVVTPSDDFNQLTGNEMHATANGVEAGGI